MTIALYDVRTAILDTLRDRLGSTAVHDGTVTAPAVDRAGRVQPYVVVWFAPGDDPEKSTAAGRAGARHGVTATCVGKDPAAAAWTADAVMDALLDARIVRDGVDVTLTFPLGVTTAPPAREDKDVKPSRWFIPLPLDAFAV